MPDWKRKVLVLRYTFNNNNDFLMKRNEIRPYHLSYFREYYNENEDTVEFKVAESLNCKSFYWPLTTTEDEMLEFMYGDPYYQEGLVQAWTIKVYKFIQRS
jgi:hypothetical protein